MGFPSARNYETGVRSTLSMQSMLILGGSGGMPPQEIFENYMPEE